MEEAPNTDPKDELLEFGFDAEGSEVNYPKSISPENFLQKSYQESHVLTRSVDPNNHNMSQSKKKPRIKLQDSKYGEWKKGMADLQSLPCLANIVSKTKRTVTEPLENRAPLENSESKVQPPAQNVTPEQVPDTKRSAGQVSRASRHVQEGLRSPAVPKASTKMLRYINLASSHDHVKPIFRDHSHKTSQPDTTAVNSSLTSSYAVVGLDTVVAAGRDSVEELLFQNRFDIPISAPHQPLRILHKLRNSRIVKRKIPIKNSLLNSISALGSAVLEPINGSFLSNKPVIASEPMLNLQVHGILQKDPNSPADIRRKRNFPSLDQQRTEQTNLKASLIDLRRQLQQFESLPRVSRTQDIKPVLADSKPFSKIRQQIRENENSRIFVPRQPSIEASRIVKMPSIMGVGFKLDRRGARSDVHPANGAAEPQQAGSGGSWSQDTTPQRPNNRESTWLEQQILRDFRQYHRRQAPPAGE